MEDQARLFKALSEAAVVHEQPPEKMEWRVVERVREIAPPQDKPLRSPQWLEPDPADEDRSTDSKDR